MIRMGLIGSRLTRNLTSQVVSYAIYRPVKMLVLKALIPLFRNKLIRVLLLGPSQPCLRVVSYLSRRNGTSRFVPRISSRRPRPE